MRVKGCGKRSVELTFYLLPGVRRLRLRASPLACGQYAESLGGRGILLCLDCADAHGLTRTSRKPVKDGDQSTSTASHA